MRTIRWIGHDSFFIGFLEYPLKRVTSSLLAISVEATALAMLALSCSVNAQEEKVDPEVKELSGISIIGNQEAPKSLYIVPWQNSEVGVATSLQSGLFDDSMRPLDKEVFQRELQYYELSHN